MEYTLRTVSDFPNGTITATEHDLEITISVTDGGAPEQTVELNKSELHEFIGVLLHIQSRIKNKK